MVLKKIAILVIIPDIKTDDDINMWDKCVKYAYELYDSYPCIEEKDISCIQRWAIGFVSWKKMIDYLQISNVNVYFIRTDFRLKDVSYTNDEDNIINIKFNYDYGHIIYKTIFSLNILQKYNYDFFVRGNANTIIDINMLSQFSQKLPICNVFTSPFFEGNSYPYGYFIMISKDISKYLTNLKLLPNNRWFQESTADDYEISEVILKKFKYYKLNNCDIPLSHSYIPPESRKTINKFGIIFRDTENSDMIISKIKKSNREIFLYRITKTSDNKYLDVYKSLIKHLWNKIVSHKFNNLIFYNETNHLVPHNEYERDEQLLVSRYIDKNDIVLELGARYGSVSCIINKILVNKKNQVSVEPDNTVINALTKNKIINKCDFYIYNGIISTNKCYNKLIMNGYGSTISINNEIDTNIYDTIDIECISLDDLQKKFGLYFNTLVADCEGFLETFLNENNFLYQQLNKIIFECDRPDVCNYNNIKMNLIKNNFKIVENGFQSVFIK